MSLDRNLYNFLIKRVFWVILFLTVLKFCLVLYGIYMEKIWSSFCARVGFHVSARFRYCRRFRKRWRSRELRRARLRLLRTRQACLNLWYDRCFACLRESLCWHMSIGEFPVACEATTRIFSEVAMISDERWPNHVVTWRAARWYCCSIPALCHPTNSDANVDGVTLSFFPPFRATTCFICQDAV